MKPDDILLTFLTGGVPVEQKTAVLQKLTDKQAKFICEIVINVIYQVIPITRGYKRKLRTHKTLLTNLTKTNKRKYLIAKNPATLILLFNAVKKTLWNFRK